MDEQVRTGATPEISVPPAVRWIVRTLEEEGYETWTVGGGIRDSLLGLPTEDWDLATRARPEAVQRCFRRTVPVGVDHGTVGVLSRNGTLYEVTTFRRDVETTGRHAVVEFADTVEEDLARRDFTINALAWHPIRRVLRDPFHGRRDLEAGVLRTVGDPRERFQEDYLRVLRALRFAGAYGLRIEEGTWVAAVEGADRLGHLAPERVREELVKVLQGVGRPSRSLGLYAASRVLKRTLPELEAMVGERLSHSGADDIWSHTLRTVDLLPSSRWDLRLVALLAGAGLPESSEAEGSGPGDRATTRSAAILERLRFSNRQIRGWSTLARWSVCRPSPEWSDAELRRWLSEVEPRRVPPLLRLWFAEARAHGLRGSGRPTVKEVLALRRRIQGLLALSPPLSLSDLRITGGDLIEMGFRPGPRFGEVLEELLERVIERPEENEPESLTRWARARLREEGE